ncbi:DUF4287 domain-containing protein [Flavitalea flava]
MTIKKTENMSINLTAYFETIKTKTGNTPDDFKKLARKKGFMVKGTLDPKIKSTEIFTWLKDEFGLGRGHAMAIYHILQGNQV